MAKGKKSGEAKGTQKRQKEDPARERPWNHPRVHPPPGAPWRREAHLRRHLRRGRGVIKSFVEGVVRDATAYTEYFPQEDRHGRGRRERAAQARQDPVRLRVRTHMLEASVAAVDWRQRHAPATIDRLATGIGKGTRHLGLHG
ncbi:hypothetical protein TcBrA4_0112210 [Trypanosoma cruzi]|nr:hypothetical protein TcBrA4_0112210 [Trypanosoma cruzi]